MKRSTENRGPATMPSFLDESTDETAVGPAAYEQEPDAEYADEDEALEEDGVETAHARTTHDLADDEELEAPADGERADALAAGPARRSKRSRATKSERAAGGGITSAFGILLALAAGVATQLPAAVEALAQRHLDAQLLAVFGLLLWGVGRSQRNSTALQLRLSTLEQERNDADDELRHALAQLHERSPSLAAAHEPGELQHLMLALQRQDQKINNLTKAIKMYGKPLMDIANQGTDIAGGVAQVRVMVESAAESTRAAVQRLEEQLRKANKQVDLGDVPDQVRQLGVSLAAVTQRLEDSEVRKSLVRLEDFAKELRQEVQVLQRGEPSQAAAEAMIARLEEARKGLAAGIQQLRDGNLSGLETSVRELLREVSSLATSTAQIQAAVKGGVRAAGSAAAPAPAPAAAAPTAPTPVASAAPVPTTGEGEGEGGSGYQTGKRTSAGKNVLGAIARLKQMKG